MPTREKLVFLSNERLSPGVNWTTLGPPLAAGLVAAASASILRPPPMSIRAIVGEWPALVRQARAADALFWMQISSRPELPILALTTAARPIRKAAYVIDAWPYALRKIGLIAKAQRLRPCFVAFREGFEELRRQFPKGDFVHLPFGVDTDAFAPSSAPKDIFAFSMGRHHPPIHAALTAYCEERNLKYVSSTGGAIKSPAELGALVARSRYFVVTPPDLDHPQRAGGFSPLVMRYLEGLAAGSRLLGTLPGSGEFQRMLPVESLLQISPDGSDLAARLDDDRRDDSGFAAAREASENVRRQHGWTNRASTIAEILSSG